MIYSHRNIAPLKYLYYAFNVIIYHPRLPYYIRLPYEAFGYYRSFDNARASTIITASGI